MTLQSGSVLKGQYRIDALIGGGGMAVVYRAFDLNLQRVCAIKQNLDTAAPAQEQFRLEAVTLASLNHAHLVRVLDHFMDVVGQQYLVMDFVEGENLDHFIRRTGPMPESQALAWMAGVLDAVAYCHSMGVIHRDIKPANLVRRHGLDSVVLVDFGIAKKMGGGVTPPGARAASPAYAPPEQLLGTRTDERSDIYALAATFYFLLTGQEPPSSLLLLTGTQKPPSPRAINPGIGLATEKAIMKAMSREMRDRPASVADFARQLQAPGPDGRRRVLLWTIIALALLVLLAGVVWASPRIIDWAGSSVAAVSTSAIDDAPSTVLSVVPMTVAPSSPAHTEEALPGDSSAPTSWPTDSAAGVSDTLIAPSPATVSVTSPATVSAPGFLRVPTSTPVTSAPSSDQSIVSVTPVTAASEATPVPEPVPTPSPVSVADLAPCPSYLHRPLAGMGLLLIENHLGEPLHIDNIATGETWDLPPKQGDVPARLVLDLPPGPHTFVDNTPRGHGRIGVTITAGSAFISPIWYNSRTEEWVHPLEIPSGCR